MSPVNASEPAKSAAERTKSSTIMNVLKKLFFPSSGERAAHALYGAVMAAARQPGHYTAGGVPDTLDGRFDLIVLHMHLAVERLRREAEGTPARELESILVEVFFADMDRSLREMGVGDLGVAKRMKDMAGAFFGRVTAYDAALQAVDAGGGVAALNEALQRNLYGNEGAAENIRHMADHIVRWRAALAATPIADVLAGRLPTV